MANSVGYIEVHAVDHCNNNCRWCHNYSPGARPKEFKASEYFAGLDILVRNGVGISLISIMGGEPFLHSNIEAFLYGFLERYQIPIIMTTNGFWLSPDAVKSYQALWKMLSILKISNYPFIIKRLGGIARVAECITAIKACNKHLHIDFPDKAYFNKLVFFDQPREVLRYCGNSECLGLLTDNRLGRCGAGAYAHLAPEGRLPEAFQHSRHMFYDLNAFEPDAFWLWRKRYPLDACRYCNFAQTEISTRWKVEPGAGGLYNQAYEASYYTTMVQRLFLHGFSAEAEATMERIAKNYPPAKETCNTLGLILCQNNRQEAAAAYFQKALALDPAYLEAARNLARLVRAQKKTVPPARG